MTHRRRTLATLAGGVAAMLTGCGTSHEVATGSSTYVLDHRMPRIDGTEESLATYEGKVLLLVNTASRCGYTGQYADLEALYRERRDDGLVVLGFPANDFMGQEPGSNEEIAEFCETRFDVSFPMFAKISVKGSEQHPLFAELESAVGAPGWNFNKYLVDRRGNVVARFGSSTTPAAAALLAEIDRLLSESAADASATTADASPTS